MSAVTDFLKTDFSGREKLDDTADLRREDANRQKYENQDLKKRDDTTLRCEDAKTKQNKKISSWKNMMMMRGCHYLK